MGRKKKEIDTEEIDEIINLYVEEKKPPSLTYNGVFTFNKTIANNEKYLRKNGGIFNLYPYNIWAGSYLGKDSYGKQKINQINNEFIADVNYSANLTDIINIINSLINKPNVLTKELCKIFLAERKELETVKHSATYYEKKAISLKKKLEKTETTMANLFFQSQSYHNSLNNMLELTRSADSVCYEEFMELFEKDEKNIRKKMEEKIYNEKIISFKNENYKKL